MAGEHEQSGEAIRRFLVGASKPPLNLPPPGWGHALAAGSANIPAMWVAAGYGFFDQHARERLLELGEIEKTRYGLAEPGFGVYPHWNFLPRLLAYDLALRRNDTAVVQALEPGIRQWLGLAIVMAARVPNTVKSASDRLAIGKLCAVLAGCRFWGFGNCLNFGGHGVLRVALGEAPPTDGSWESLTLKRCALTLRGLAAPFIGKSLDEVVAMIPQYGARETFEFYHYEDGSRVSIMGHSEENGADEDPNSNTPGMLAVVFDAGRKTWTAYPEHPDPLTGAERLRQTNAYGDIQATPDGWLLRHSHFGRRKAPDGKIETDIPRPNSKLVSAWRAPKGVVGWVNLMKKEEEPVPPPAPVPPSAPPKKRNDKWTDWL